MRILVIEDEVRIQAFLARGLEAEGYAVAGRTTDVTGSCSRRADVGSRGPRPPPAGHQRPARARGDPPRLPGAAGADPLRARRSADEAEGLRARRAGLRPEAVLARRAARARFACSSATRGRVDEEHVAAGRPRSCSTSRGGRRGSASRVRPLRPRVPPPPPARPARRRGDQPRAAARGGLGLLFDPRLERRRRLRPPAAPEARARRSDRDGSACGLPAGSA